MKKSGDKKADAQDDPRPRKWAGLRVSDTPHWWWFEGKSRWSRAETSAIRPGEIIVPGRFPKPTEPPPADIEETDDIEWLRG